MPTLHPPLASAEHSPTSTIFEAPLPAHADLAFPQLTTDTELAGFTTEYRQATEVGIIPWKDGTTKDAPLPEGLKHAPTTNMDKLKSVDPERAVQLQNALLVTWKMSVFMSGLTRKWLTPTCRNDPERPSNWSKPYRWFLTILVATAVSKLTCVHLVPC